MYETYFPKKRFQITIDFLNKNLSKNSRILDLGVENPLSALMKAEGFIVNNTSGEDIDDDCTAIEHYEGDAVTAFEIFEHLVAPYSVLKAIKTNHLFISVPTRLWFSKAYRNSNDKRDQHYHEFEPWQLDYVIEKAGWEVIDSVKFTNPVKKIGLRPLLRLFTNRYYLVYCRPKQK